MRVRGSIFDADCDRLAGGENTGAARLELKTGTEGFGFVNAGVRAASAA